MLARRSPYVAAVAMVTTQPELTRKRCYGPSTELPTRIDPRQPAPILALCRSMRRRVEAMDFTRNARSLWIRLLAVVVLAVAAWVLLKLIVGALTTVAWIVAVVIALAGIAWALNFLRR